VAGKRAAAYFFARGAYDLRSRLALGVTSAPRLVHSCKKLLESGIEGTKFPVYVGMTISIQNRTPAGFSAVACRREAPDQDEDEGR